jgi:sulfur-oxidizing protein SoxZ
MSTTIAARLIKEVTEIRVSIQHASEDGQRQDAKTGRFIPATFVQQLQIKADERLLIDSNLGGGLAHNPQFVFMAKGLKAGAKITVDWTGSAEIINKQGRKEDKPETGHAETILKG